MDTRVEGAVGDLLESLDCDFEDVGVLDVVDLELLALAHESRAEVQVSELFVYLSL